MKKAYGDQASLEYVDMEDPGIAEFPEVAEAIRQGDLIPPVVIIDGSALFDGGIPWRSIVRELERRGLREISVDERG